MQELQIMWQSIYLCHSPHPPFSGSCVCTVYHLYKENQLSPFFSLVIVSTFVPWLPLTRPVKAAYVKCRIKGDPELHTNQLRGDLSVAHPKGVQPNRESSWWIIYTQVLPLSHFSLKAITKMTEGFCFSRRVRNNCFSR